MCFVVVTPQISLVKDFFYSFFPLYIKDNLFNKQMESSRQGVLQLLIICVLGINMSCQSQMKYQPKKKIQIEWFLGQML